MKLLLDTCCIIWAVSDPSSLSGKATDVLEREDSAIFVSPISCAEIACLSERGRIESLGVLFPAACGDKKTVL